MKMKKIKVSKYIFRDKDGYPEEFDNVEILLDMDSVVTPENFNQDKDIYYISSKEIDRMYKESLERWEKLKMSNLGALF